MVKKRTGITDHPAISALLQEKGESDPCTAMRVKAAAVIEQFRACFSDTQPPLNMEALASSIGILTSDERPLHSPDAELVPDGDGGVVMRVNEDRPRTRRRFSIGHEIGHTFFAGFEEKVRCRKPGSRDWADPDDLIESLCDVAASALLFPSPWFEEDVETMSVSAASLVALARKYQASPDATVRRFVEVSHEPRAAVFFAWKLKPTQESKLIGIDDQPCMFGIDPRTDANELRKLRVEYSIPSPAFDRHIPADKSVDDKTVICRAAAGGECLDGEEYVDLGPVSGRFLVHAIPLFTADDAFGPRGERAVVAVIHPARKTSKGARETKLPTRFSAF